MFQDIPGPREGDLAESGGAGRFLSDCRQIIQLSFVKITDGYLSDINNLKIGFYEPVRNVYLTATGGCYNSVFILIRYTSIYCAYIIFHIIFHYI